MSVHPVDGMPAFIKAIFDGLPVDRRAIDLDLPLQHQLVDSLIMFELAVNLEEMGIDLDDLALADPVTVSELYQLYLTKSIDL